MAHNAMLAPSRTPATAVPHHCGMLLSFARAFSSTPAPQPEQPEAPPERTHFGGLKDEDRIFTNLYGQHDPFLKVGRV